MQSRVCSRFFGIKSEQKIQRVQYTKTVWLRRHREGFGKTAWTIGKIGSRSPRWIWRPTAIGWWWNCRQWFCSNRTGSGRSSRPSYMSAWNNGGVNGHSSARNEITTPDAQRVFKSVQAIQKGVRWGLKTANDQRCQRNQNIAGELRKFRTQKLIRRNLEKMRRRYAPPHSCRKRDWSPKRANQTVNDQTIHDERGKLGKSKVVVGIA